MASFLDQEFPDEEEDDFNPQPEQGSDDEGEPAATTGNEVEAAGDDEQEVAEEEEPEAEDDEEEDEEEDEDDDDVSGQPSRKRRKRRRNQFIDVEAEVDEDDEEEPEEEDDLPGEEMHPDDLQELPPGADRDDRAHRELDRQREREEAEDVEKTAARLKERYGRQGRAADAGSAIVPQRLLLPGVSDPRIWRLKCRPGKEREIIFAITQRILDRAGGREPVQIFSAFERSGPMGGNLYVEAARQDDIMPALEGISHIFFGTKPSMIAVEEMPDLLRVRPSKQLEAGMYVRPRRGLYQGDLALIEEVESNGTVVVLKLVPRLDYGASEDANAPLTEPDGQGGIKRKRFQKPTGTRPPARLFSESEAKKKHGRYLQRAGGLSNNVWNYQNKEYVNGFLVESFKVSAVQTEDVNPTLEEVTKFAAGSEEGTEHLDLAALAATLKASSGADYLPGDKVEIFRGEQKGLSGRAVEVYGEVIKLRVDDGPLMNQIIEAPIKELRKVFREGDHVKVIGGSKYQDEVGMVVRVKNDQVTILTDSNQQEIQLFSKDLREATDSGGVVGAGKYDLFDLVQLDAATVGCVVKVDRESLRVMDQLGVVRNLLPSNISNKIEKRNNQGPATDRQGAELHTGDVIKEYGGEGKTGPVLHIHRGYVFARSFEVRDNAGVFVARTSNVEIHSTKGGQVGPDITKMKTGLRPNGAGAAPMPPPILKGRDRLIGKTVRIRQGPQKGMIGIVKDSTDTTAFVELHAKNKKIPIDKTKLAVVDADTGTVLHADASLFGSGRGAGPPGRGPMIGGQTPGRYGAPPPGAGAARTPAYALGGGRTPAWKQDGGRTPAYAQAAGGGQTAYGGGFGGSTSYGGQTSYGGATSYGGGSVWGGGGGGGGGQSTWNPNSGGGRTPAYLSGSKTPAYSGGMEAPTPGYNSAPTPGNYGDQPTPGGYRGGQYQTPAAYNTPGGFPETPAPYSAPTPGADDGPGYN